MAKKTTTSLVDDIDGSDADTTVTYTWQGQAYEIDLSTKNAEEFAEAMAPYLSASRKAGRGSSGASARRGSALPKASDALDPRKIRVWAAENGVEVSPRGRINAKVLEQYRAAHQ
jgi:hypothetical protein